MQSDMGDRFGIKREGNASERHEAQSNRLRRHASSFPASQQPSLPLPALHIADSITPNNVRHIEWAVLVRFKSHREDTEKQSRHPKGGRGFAPSSKINR